MIDEIGLELFKNQILKNLFLFTCDVTDNVKSDNPLMFLKNAQSWTFLNKFVHFDNETTQYM